MAQKIIPTTSEASRKAAADALGRCPYCGRKFNAQGLAGHKRHCTAKA